MEAIDIIIVILLVIGFIGGLKEGVVNQVAGLVGLIVGLLLSKKFYLSVADTLTPLLGMSERTTQILAFVLILIVVPLLFSLVAWLISKLIKKVGLGWINRLLGSAAGILQSALFAGLIITAIESFDIARHLISHEKKEASALYYPLYNMTGVLINDVRAYIKDRKEEQKGDDAEPAPTGTDEKSEDADAPMPFFEELV